LQPRFRIRENTPRFRLDTQESQWSGSTRFNQFQPVDEKSKSLKSQEIDDDQEIVTAGPETENVSCFDGLVCYQSFQIDFLQDSYLINVSASVMPAKQATADDDDAFDETINMISTTEKDVVAGGKKANDE